MKLEEKISTASNDELVTMWKNANKTFARCGGHQKAAMNEFFVEEYVKEMVSRNIPIPSNYDDGVFNGVGSF